MTVNDSSVKLPKEILSRVEDRVELTDFNDKSEYITFVLEETLYHVEQNNDAEEIEVDEEEIQDRLRSLGYIDG